MRLTEIPINLLQIIAGVSAFANFTSDIFIDNGARESAMESSLNSQERGMCILIGKTAHSIERFDSTRGCESLAFADFVWLRTNPKIPSLEETRWDPDKMQQDIIEAVMQWSKNRNDFGFYIHPHLLPEPVETDSGLDSRLIYFTTKVQFK